MAILGWATINKTRPTGFRLYFKPDDNNDKVADFARFNGGKPELVIQYILP
jgi:hypothetical protein